MQSYLDLRSKLVDTHRVTNDGPAST
jgi:hypothetical protein